MRNLKAWWILVIILSLVAPSQAEVMDRIVAIVNGDIILLSEMNAAFAPYKKRIEQAYQGEDREKALSEAGPAFLRRLIDGRLIEQEAKKNGIIIDDEEVMTAIRNILAYKNMSYEDFVKGMEQEGIALNAYKRDVKEQLVKARLIRREISSKLIVTDEEIGEYYRNNRSDYEGREAVHVKQIFLAFPRGADETTRSRARKAAEEIRLRIKNGESFEALAADPSLEGGDLGFIERGITFPALEEAAFSLKPGEVSGLIESPSGYHIIMVVDRRGGGLKPIGEVREEIRAKIEEQKMGQKFEEWLSALRKNANIDIKQ